MATVMTDEIVSTLNELIQTCEDGAEGYKKAADDVQDSSLKALFSGYSAQRVKYAAELRTVVESNGGKAADSGHAAASLHRGWMSVKEAVGNKDKAIIDECEAGEDRAMKAYRDAFEKNLPGTTGELVNIQFAGVQEAHNKLRNLKHSQN
jgi:uncharacterized protein (TIGR02284 family)